MNLTIIQLGIFHLNSCLDLDQKSLQSLWTKSQWERELTDPKRICIGIIDPQSKNILGLCSSWVILDELHITFFAIHPKHQRKGLGKFLISDLIKRSNSLRANRIYLEVKETTSKQNLFIKLWALKLWVIDLIFTKMEVMPLSSKNN